MRVVQTSPPRHTTRLKNLPPPEPRLGQLTCMYVYVGEGGSDPHTHQRGWKKGICKSRIHFWYRDSQVPPPEILKNPEFQPVSKPSFVCVSTLVEKSNQKKWGTISYKGVCMCVCLGEKERKERKEKKEKNMGIDICGVPLQIPVQSYIIRKDKKGVSF
ncbi:hypothetical protein EYR41_010200 [Orbilia oligospora]|uniref:Uncharacterized protein n=1 Tax=Orbilia oligospora TaxID=2813651 RepID=A0A8H2HJW0_ORBOL|nr:hypothetical protein EYR41_010200 [Orbilia oligospora]